MTHTRICNGPCHLKLHVTYFYQDRTKAFGRQSRCKLCMSIYHHERYLKKKGLAA
jgi:hypothetical protein